MWGQSEWITLLQGPTANTYKVIRDTGEELELIDNKTEPLDDQIVKLLRKRRAP